MIRFHYILDISTELDKHSLVVLKKKIEVLFENETRYYPLEIELSYDLYTSVSFTRDLNLIFRLESCENDWTIVELNDLKSILEDKFNLLVDTSC